MGSLNLPSAIHLHYLKVTALVSACFTSEFVDCICGVLCPRASGQSLPLVWRREASTSHPYTYEPEKLLLSGI